MEEIAMDPLAGCLRYTPYDEAIGKNVRVQDVSFRTFLDDAISLVGFGTIPAKLNLFSLDNDVDSVMIFSIFITSFQQHSKNFIKNFFSGGKTILIKFHQRNAKSILNNYDKK